MRRRSELGIFAPVAFLGVVNFGIATAVASALVAAAGDSVPAIPAVGVGTGAAGVASLAWYISRKLMSGEVTPTPITDLHKKQDKIIEMLLADREHRAANDVELRSIVKESTQAMFAVNDYLLRADGARLSRPTVRPPTT